ncbi:glycosyltransferase family 2 protein [Candidatus Saccharibacteria bacterium]|nr:glycosyltransferase family 2 protein [Candidatus Saccharibacteria bacterium]
MNPKVSIIIPAFNSEDFLERCVKSAISQTYDNIEIIIVDDGSTDETAKISKSLKESNNRIKYVFQENRGLPSARNTGMKLASGDYYYFLDSDDTIDDTLIENLIKKQQQNTLVGSNFKNIFQNKPSEGNRKGKYKTDDFLKEIFEDKKPSFVCGYLFDAKRCTKISFDEKTRYYEDMLFLVRYLNTGIEKVLLLPDKFYNYYQNPKSITLSSANITDKLKDIILATEKTNRETDNRFVEKNNNRKIGLFEAILQRADEKKLKEIVDAFKLPEYTGTSKRLKLFSNLYQKKNIKGLLRYYKLRNLGKRLVLKIKR